MVRAKNTSIRFVVGALMFLSCGLLFAQESINKAQFLEKVWNFEKNSDKLVLESDVPVILDFWAPWCGPCRMLAPELTALQKDFPTQLKIYKINVDNERDLARTFGANALPTIYFIRKDKITYVQGYRTKAELKQIVDNFLLK